ncbi:MAG TPA: YbhB/YbcL family Raf kinase inhibitor-like protein [Acidimicrobiales bacterium]|nr:YbhB/YbcL family Raf kinase inhibitor-like protein [Acidimicrobiales bacterium]
MTRLALLLAAAAVAVTACSHDGRALRPAGPNQTASIITTTSSTAAAAVNPGGQRGSSSARSGVTGGSGMTIVTPWADGALIDAQYTCKGADTSPAISWSGVPATAKELAIAFTDLDADDFVHWVIAGLPSAAIGLAANTVPQGAVQANNGFNEASYSGPCPPDHQHTYLMTLYALGQPSGLTPGMDGKAAIGRLEATQIASTAISGVFG